MIGAKARRRLLVPIVGLVAALGVAACGSDDDSRQRRQLERLGR